MERNHIHQIKEKSHGYDVFFLTGQPFDLIGRTQRAPAVIAEKSANEIYKWLKHAYEGHKTITLLVHAPPGAGKSITLRKISEMVANANIPEIEASGFPIIAELQEISIENLLDQTKEGIENSIEEFYRENALTEFKNRFETVKEEIESKYEDKTFVNILLMVEALKITYKITRANYLFYVIDEFDAILPGGKELHDEKDVSKFLHKMRSLLDELCNLKDVEEYQLPLLIAMSHTESSNKEFKDYIENHSDALATSIVGEVELGYSFDEICKFFEKRLESKRRKDYSGEKYYPFTIEQIKTIFDSFKQKPDRLVNMRAVDRCCARILDEGKIEGGISNELINQICAEVGRDLERKESIPPNVKTKIFEILDSPPIKKVSNIYDSLLHLLRSQNMLTIDPNEAPEGTTVLQTPDVAAILCQIPIIHQGKIFYLRLAFSVFEKEPEKVLFDDITKSLFDDKENEHPHERIIIYTYTVPQEEKIPSDLQSIYLSHDLLENLLTYKELPDGHTLKKDYLTHLYRDIILQINKIVLNIKDIYDKEKGRIVTKAHKNVIGTLAANINVERGFVDDLTDLCKLIYDRGVQIDKNKSELVDMGFIKENIPNPPPSLQALLDLGEEFKEDDAMKLLGNRWGSRGLKDLIIDCGIFEFDKATNTYIRRIDAWKKRAEEVLEKIGEKSLSEEGKKKLLLTRKLLTPTDDDFLNAINYHTAFDVSKEIQKLEEKTKKKEELPEESPYKEEIVNLENNLKSIEVDELAKPLKEQQLEALDRAKNDVALTKNGFEDMKSDVEDFISKVGKKEGITTIEKIETKEELKRETKEEKKEERDIKMNLRQKIISLFEEAGSFTIKEIRNKFPNEPVIDVDNEINALLKEEILKLTKGS